MVDGGREVKRTLNLLQDAEHHHCGRRKRVKCGERLNREADVRIDIVLQPQILRQHHHLPVLLQEMEVVCRVYAALVQYPVFRSLFIVRAVVDTFTREVQEGEKNDKHGSISVYSNSHGSETWEDAGTTNAHVNRKLEEIGHDRRRALERDRLRLFGSSCLFG